MSIFPKVPKIEKPKEVLKPLTGAQDALDAARTSGQDSLISAGALKKKATTLKASLLGTA